MFNIIGKRKYWFGLSTVLVALSIIAILVFGLNYGIDFTGGSIMELELVDASLDNAEVDQILTDLEITESVIQPAGDNTLLIRTGHLTEQQHNQIFTNLETKVIQQEGSITQLRYDSIGPTIGKELKGKAMTSLFVVMLAIVAYIAFAFRKVSFPVASWKYGLSAIVALAHDVIITVGLFSVLGYYFNFQVDTLFVTALLTIMGFSVHDTIVTFDRTRENLFRTHDLTFAQIVNTSINETIVRSLNTSLTTLLVLVSVYFFGGVSIQQFILTMIFGIIIGTYSSIFLASPLLMVWYKLKQ
ncbi:protein translocase subunit SecF [Patescibacteria group bacterium]|nr:protein translocase subunit SecF [Patescibacteria group bacterium]